MRMAGRDVVEVNKETKVCELRKVNTQITLQRTRRSSSREPDTASIFLAERCWLVVAWSEIQVQSIGMQKGKNKGGRHKKNK